MYKALALSSPPNARSLSSTSQMNVAEHHQVVFEADDGLHIESLECKGGMIAVGGSLLQGQNWHGALYVVNAATAEHVCRVTTQCGISSVAWCGVENKAIAVGCDNYDVQVSVSARSMRLF